MMEKRPSSCGCHRSAPACDCCPPAPPSPGNIFLQKILGSGRLHHRRKCYAIEVHSMPCECAGSPTLQRVSVCGMPAWEDVSCHERGVKLLRVMIPLSLEFRDCSSGIHTASGVVEEKLRLRLTCQPGDAWRGQIMLQAAARLCGSVCASGNCCPEVPLELILCGYLLAPYAMDYPDTPPCPPPKPWYPQPHFNPYQD